MLFFPQIPCFPHLNNGKVIFQIFSDFQSPWEPRVLYVLVKPCRWCYARSHMILLRKTSCFHHTRFSSVAVKLGCVIAIYGIHLFGLVCSGGHLVLDWLQTFISCWCRSSNHLNLQMNTDRRKNIIPWSHIQCWMLIKKLFLEIRPIQHMIKFKLFQVSLASRRMFSVTITDISEKCVSLWMKRSFKKPFSQSVSHGVIYILYILAVAYCNHMLIIPSCTRTVPAHSICSFLSFFLYIFPFGCDFFFPHNDTFLPFWADRKCF